jgi:hypothetical protein
MDRDAITRYLAALDDEQFAELASEARADPDPAKQVRAAEAAGDWNRSFALKAAQLRDLLRPPKD